mmetsp:Transcript_70459/g.111346  ORF Transcript_70459/g.111346 Transcript_70459/m.111346 type:complete len:361 (-) Transcript_70459:850-1932(-)
MQDAVQVDFPRAKQDMLATFFHLGFGQAIGLVDLPQAIDHLGQLCRLQRLNGHLDNWRGREPKRSENLHLLFVGCCGDGGRLLDASLNSTDQNPIACRHMTDFHTIPALENPEVLNLLDCHVLIIIQGVGLTQDLHSITAEDGTTHHTPEDVEGIAVGAVVLLHNVQHQVACRIQILHILGHGTVLISGIQLLHLGFGTLLRSRDVPHHHVDERRQTSARAKVLLEDLPDQRPRVQFVVALVQINSHLGQRLLQVFLLFTQAMREDFVDGLQHKLHEGARLLRIWGRFGELVRICIKVHVSPKALGEHEMVKTETMSFCIDRCVGFQGEHHSKLSGAEQDVAPQRGEVDAVVHLCTDRVV